VLKSLYKIVLIAVVIILGVTLYTASKKSPSLTQNSVPQTSDNSEPSSPTKGAERTTVVATGLEVPWALAFLPNGDLLVTERPGRVRIIKDGVLLEKPLLTLSDVKLLGESGLHGIAVDPNFSNNSHVFIYYTYQAGTFGTSNRVVRYALKNDNLVDPKTVVDNIPGAMFHDGGRLKFGPDNLLYITTGDAQEPSLSQDKSSLAGKILRVEKDGTVIRYSYGHRNPQGIAWDDKGQLWEVEHGQSATDELNSIEQGKNYGWPTIRGDQTQSSMIPPQLHSGSNTWAPGGLSFYNNFLFFAGLRGQALYQVKLPDPSIRYVKQPDLIAVEHFRNELGRIRDVVVGPDNMLYITTSNRDGRGTPKNEDDKIIRVNPSLLQ
jgi:glucose/arabinose dehydrogenase